LANKEGRKTSIMGGDVKESGGHPLDNIGHYNTTRNSSQIGAKQGIFGEDSMMAGKSGILNDGGKVNFGKSRGKCMERVRNLQPVSAYTSCVNGDEDEVYKLLCK